MGPAWTTVHERMIKKWDEAKLQYGEAPAAKE
jgi:hypothetical protein